MENNVDSKSKKKRKNKKKSNANTNADTSAGSSSHVQSSGGPAFSQPNVSEERPTDDHDESEQSEAEQEDSEAPNADNLTSTATSVDEEAVASLTNGTASMSISNDIAAATARFDALVRDRDALREEVTRLRQSLEEVQSKHDRDRAELESQLQDSQAECETTEEKYQNLLGKVNTIRSQLGERLKADAEDLAQARSRIEELEEEKVQFENQKSSKDQQIQQLTTQQTSMQKELGELRGRVSTSQSNWAKEREELQESETYLQEELEQAKQAMHDWEVLAMEERNIRRDLSDRVADLEEQLSTVQKDFERAAADRDSQSNTVDGLQKAMQEIQNARKKELRELVESSQEETTELRKLCESTKDELKTVHQQLSEAREELDRALPFEKEVKEKNLLIGKLRHEAVILADNLTKALRLLKKGKPEDNVDRQIVTNHFLQFLALDRSDPKKFQVLQLIAALLNWSDEQKELAGLQRAGGASQTGSLRLPGTPMMHRTPSSPALSRLDNDLFDNGASPASKESLADLWQNFLEQEASSSNGQQGNRKSRQPSTSSAAMTSPTLPKPQS